MPKKIKYEISLKNGNKLEVEGTEIVPGYAYDRREMTVGETINKNGEHKTLTSKTYILTHIPTGTLITSADKVKTLKLLCTEPEFFDEFDPQALLKAVGRFWGKHEWQEKDI